MLFKNYKTFLLFLLLIIGSINPILFLFKSPMIIKTKNYPISPLPLVFDSPRNFKYWSYNIQIKLHLLNEIKLVNGDSILLENHRRGWLFHLIYESLMGSLIIEPETHESKKVIGSLLCNHFLYYLDNHDLRKVLKVELIVPDENKLIIRHREYLCQ